MHRTGDLVCVHDHSPVDVACGTTAGLDQGTGAAQEALLVGVKDSDQLNLRDIQPFPQQVDANQNIKDALAQIANNANTLNGVDIGMQVAAADTDFIEITSQILCHTFGQRSDQDPALCCNHQTKLMEQIIHLADGRPDLDRRVDQAGGTNNLLNDHTSRLSQFIIPGSC